MWYNTGMAIGNRLHIYRQAAMLHYFKYTCVVCGNEVDKPFKPSHGGYYKPISSSKTLPTVDNPLQYALCTSVREGLVFPTHAICALSLSEWPLAFILLRLSGRKFEDVRRVSKRAQKKATEVIKGKYHKGIYEIATQLWQGSKDYQRRVPTSVAERLSVNRGD